MGRGEVMGLRRKGKERQSRNTQVRSNGKSVTAVLQSNAETGACALVLLSAVVGCGRARRSCPWAGRP